MKAEGTSSTSAPMPQVRVWVLMPASHYEVRIHFLASAAFFQGQHPLKQTSATALCNFIRAHLLLL